MGKVLVLDDFRDDKNFLECYERRAKTILPPADNTHKYLLVCYRKDSGYVNIETSEAFSPMELAWIFTEGPKMFHPVD